MMRRILTLLADLALGALTGLLVFLAGVYLWFTWLRSVG